MSNPITQDGTYEDYTTKQRKHYSGSRGSLGAGLVPEGDEKPLPHTLNRTRVVHDTAEQYEDQSNFMSTNNRPQADSPWMSSYQAQCQGADKTEGKRPGRKQLAPTGTKDLLYSAPRVNAPGLGPRPDDDPIALQLGTTKVTGHVPGYTGHIPKTNPEGNIGADSRTLGKDLLVENYRHNVPGYTGSRK